MKLRRLLFLGLIVAASIGTALLAETYGSLTGSILRNARSWG